MQNHVYETTCKNDTMAMEAKYGCERIDRMYRAMKKDVCRHETLCYELADKFEKQHDVFL
jgi:hypothetical protein